MPLHHAPRRAIESSRPCVYELARILHTIRGLDRRRRRRRLCSIAVRIEVRDGACFGQSGSFHVDNVHRLSTMNDSHSARFASQNEFGPLATHGRFPYRPITDSDGFRWPDGSGTCGLPRLQSRTLRVRRGAGRGARSRLAATRRAQLQLARVRQSRGRMALHRAVRCSSTCPSGTLINTALYDHCPELIDACVARGDELIGARAHECATAKATWMKTASAPCFCIAASASPRSPVWPPAGWLSPWISESHLTPDLLARNGLSLYAELVPRRPPGAHGDARWCALVDSLSAGTQRHRR